MPVFPPSGGGGAESLNDLSDVDITILQDNDLLEFISGSWKNKTGVFEGITGLGIQEKNFILKANDTHPISILDKVEDASLLLKAREVFVSGQFAYVTSPSSDRLTIVDISDPKDMKIRGSVQDNTNLDGAHGVYVVGKYAYVVSILNHALSIIDVSNSEAPVRISTFGDISVMNNADSVYVVGKYAYVTAIQGSSLTILDISDPTNIIFVNSITNTALSGASHIVVVGKYAYVSASSNNSISILDISNPLNLSILKTIQDVDFLGDCSNVVVSGNYAYAIAFTTNSFAVIDISDISEASIVKSIVSEPLLEQANGLFIAGNYAYVVSEESKSFVVIDISDPPNSAIVDSVLAVNDLNGAHGVFVSGKFAFVSSEDGDSLTSIDISGIDVPNISTGSIETEQLSVTNNVIVKNDISANAINTDKGNIEELASKNLNSANATISEKLLVENPIEVQGGASNFSVGSGIGFKTKEAVRMASTGNIDLGSLFGPSSIDGITIADFDRVLLKNQTNQNQNGIYSTIINSDPSSWVRTSDANTEPLISKLGVFVTLGNSSGGKTFAQVGVIIPFNTTPIIFAETLVSTVLDIHPTGVRAKGNSALTGKTTASSEDITIANNDTPVKISSPPNNWNADQLSLFTHNELDGGLTYIGTETHTFLITFSVSAKINNGSSSPWFAQILKNSTRISNSEIRLLTGNSSDFYNVGASFLIDLDEDDSIFIVVGVEDGASAVLDIATALLSIVQAT